MGDPVQVGEEVHVTLKYYEGQALIHVSAYQADPSRIAIFLCTPSYEPVVVATVHIPEVALAEDEVLIKAWSENEGVDVELTRLGILKEPVRTFTLAYPTHELHVGVYKVSEVVLEAKKQFDNKSISQLVRAIPPNNNMH